LADSNGYGCLVYDQVGVAWQAADLCRGEVRVIVGDIEIAPRAIWAGWDVVEAVRWLANDASRWAGGLMVGHLVAVPTGAKDVQVPADVPVHVMVGGLGRVDIQVDNDRGRTRQVNRHLAELAQNRTNSDQAEWCLTLG
jgi:hypothetical protein